MKKSLTKAIALLLSGTLLFSSSAATLANKPKSKTVLTTQIDKKLEKQVEDLIKTNIKNEIFPSAQVVIVKNGVITVDLAVGDAQLYDMGKKLEAPRATTKQTLYDMASCTKILATTNAIMMMVDQGKVHLDTPVAKYLPGFEKNGKADVTIRQLLLHTSGLAEWEPAFLYVNNRKDLLKKIKAMPLDLPVGQVAYSDIGINTLSFVVEEITKQNFDDFCEKQIYAKLNMKHTVFNPLKKGFEKQDVAASSWGNPFEIAMVDEDNFPGFAYDTKKDMKAFKTFKGWRNYTLVGEVNDGNAAMANEGVAGHAGLFTTASDVAILGQLMLNGGEYNGVRLYRSDVLEQFTKNYSRGFVGDQARGLGFETPNKRYMGERVSMNSFGHNGFSGTNLTFDPDNQIQVIVLTNKQNLGLNKKADTVKYTTSWDFSQELCNAVYDYYKIERVIKY